MVTLRPGWFDSISRAGAQGGDARFESLPIVSTTGVMSYRGVGKSGLIRLIWDQEIGGSNPPTPTN